MGAWGSFSDSGNSGPSSDTSSSGGSWGSFSDSGYAGPSYGGSSSGGGGSGWGTFSDSGYAHDPGAYSYGGGGGGSSSGGSGWGTFSDSGYSHGGGSSDAGWGGFSDSRFGGGGLLGGGASDASSGGRSQSIFSGGPSLFGGGSLPSFGGLLGGGMPVASLALGLGGLVARNLAAPPPGPLGSSVFGTPAPAPMQEGDAQLASNAALKAPQTVQSPWSAQDTATDMGQRELTAPSWQRTLENVAAPNVDVKNLNPQYGQNLADLLKGGPNSLFDPGRTDLVSGARNNIQQQQAIQDQYGGAAARLGLPAWGSLTPAQQQRYYASGVHFGNNQAAAVGGSMHQLGAAADLNYQGDAAFGIPQASAMSPAEKSYMAANAGRYGLTFIGNDPGHIQAQTRAGFSPITAAYSPVGNMDQAYNPSQGQVLSQAGFYVSPSGQPLGTGPALASTGGTYVSAAQLASGYGYGDGGAPAFAQDVAQNTLTPSDMAAQPPAPSSQSDASVVSAMGSLAGGPLDAVAKQFAAAYAQDPAAAIAGARQYIAYTLTNKGFVKSSVMPASLNTNGSYDTGTAGDFGTSPERPPMQPSPSSYAAPIGAADSVASRGWATPAPTPQTAGPDFAHSFEASLAQTQPSGAPGQYSPPALPAARIAAAAAAAAGLATSSAGTPYAPGPVAPNTPPSGGLTPGSQPQGFGPAVAGPGPTPDALGPSPQPQGYGPSLPGMPAPIDGRPLDYEPLQQPRPGSTPGALPAAPIGPADTVAMRGWATPGPYSPGPTDPNAPPSGSFGPSPQPQGYGPAIAAVPGPLSATGLAMPRPSWSPTPGDAPAPVPAPTQVDTSGIATVAPAVSALDAAASAGQLGIDSKQFQQAVTAVTGPLKQLLGPLGTFTQGGAAPSYGVVTKQYAAAQTAIAKFDRVVSGLSPDEQAAAAPTIAAVDAIGVQLASAKPSDLQPALAYATGKDLEGWIGYGTPAQQGQWSNLKTGVAGGLKSLDSMTANNGSAFGVPTASTPMPVSTTPPPAIVAPSPIGPADSVASRYNSILEQPAMQANRHFLIRNTIQASNDPGPIVTNPISGDQYQPGPAGTLQPPTTIVAVNDRPPVVPYQPQADAPSGPVNPYRGSGSDYLLANAANGTSPQTLPVSGIVLPPIGANWRYGADWGLNQQRDPSWVQRLYAWEQGPMNSVFGG